MRPTRINHIPGRSWMALHVRKTMCPIDVFSTRSRTKNMKPCLMKPRKVYLSTAIRLGLGIDMPVVTSVLLAQKFWRKLVTVWEVSSRSAISVLSPCTVLLLVFGLYVIALGTKARSPRAPHSNSDSSCHSRTRSSLVNDRAC